MMAGKILILGKGWIGTTLYNYLKAKKYNVVILSKAEFDYTNIKAFAGKNYFINNNICYVINCSGYTGVPNVDACESNKAHCWHYNVTVPLIISDACRDSGTPLINISSGCIYNGNDKIYNEKDLPNFGMWNSESSYYSKSKHACEILLGQRYKTVTLRIRMPFDDTAHPKNIITKMGTYRQIMSVPNSLTYLPDLCAVTEQVLQDFFNKNINPVVNVVNPGAVEAKTIVDMLVAKGLRNDQPQYVSEADLNLVAKRSNCVLESLYYPISTSAVQRLEEVITKMSRI